MRRALFESRCHSERAQANIGWRETGLRSWKGTCRPSCERAWIHFEAWADESKLALLSWFQFGQSFQSNWRVQYSIHRWKWAATILQKDGPPARQKRVNHNFASIRFGRRCQNFIRGVRRSSRQNTTWRYLEPFSKCSGGKNQERKFGKVVEPIKLLQWCGKHPQIEILWPKFDQTNLKFQTLLRRYIWEHRGRHSEAFFASGKLQIQLKQHSPINNTKCTSRREIWLFKPLISC